MSNYSLFQVSTDTQDETGCQCGRKQLRPGKIQIIFFQISSKLKIKFWQAFLWLLIRLDEKPNSYIFDRVTIDL